MFRAVLCLSSVGHIVLLQHLVSSLSVNGHIVRRLRTDSALNRHTVQPFTEIVDTRCCNIQYDLLKISTVLLKTCRGL